MIHNSRNLLWMLSLNVALNAQDSIALKNDNAQVTEDGSISISVLKNDDIKDKLKFPILFLILFYSFRFLGFQNSAPQ